MISRKERLLARINILLDENVERSKAVIKEADELFFELLRPTNFSSSSSENIFETRAESFERLCISMEKYGAVSTPKSYTIYEFYKRFEVISENVRSHK